MSITMPEKKAGLFGKIIGPAATVVGAGVGTFLAPAGGGLVGAGLGASLGGALGGTAGAVANKDVGQGAASVAQGVVGGISGARAMGAGGNDAALEAMKRKVDAAAIPLDPAPSNMNSDTAVLGEGVDALNSLPPEAQKQYGSQIAGAYQHSLRRHFRGMP